VVVVVACAEALRLGGDDDDHSIDELAAPPPLDGPDQDAGGIRSIRAAYEEDSMRFGRFRFGSIQIDDTLYEHDVVIDGGRIRKRKKKPSKSFRGSFGHTPLSNAEDIPWVCRQLVVGTGANGALPVMEDVKREARARHVELVVLPTAQAIEELAKGSNDMNAILHVTC
jgi:hypothetical protein